MRTAIVTDSNSGIFEAEGRDLGVFVVPMPVIIEGKEYLEGVNLFHEEFYQSLIDNRELSTSQPTPGSVLAVWDMALSEGFDELVYIPMSSGLSSSCQTALMLAEDYDGKVFVVNNQRISVTQKRSVLDAIELAKQGRSGAEIRDFLEETKLESSIYITVDTLKYLKQGGRVTPAAAAIGTILNIKPVLQIQGEKLDAFAKARTVKKAKQIMIKAIQDDLANRFQDPAAEKAYISMAYTHDLEAAEEFKAEVQEIFPNHEIYMQALPLSISCHIGPGALAVTCTQNIDHRK